MNSCDFHFSVEPNHYSKHMKFSLYERAVFASDSITHSSGLRLVDELALLYKEAALRIAREQIRSSVLEILILLQQ